MKKVRDILVDKFFYSFYDNIEREIQYKVKTKVVLQTVAKLTNQIWINILREVINSKSYLK